MRGEELRMIGDGRDGLLERQGVIAAEGLGRPFDRRLHQPLDFPARRVVQGPKDALQPDAVGDEVGFRAALDPPDRERGRVGGLDGPADDRLEGVDDSGRPGRSRRRRPGAGTPGRSGP